MGFLRGSWLPRDFGSRERGLVGERRDQRNFRRREFKRVAGLRRCVVPMDPIRSFCAKLRSLAVTLDGETARLQRALEREDGGEWAGGRRRNGHFRVGR